MSLKGMLLKYRVKTFFNRRKRSIKQFFRRMYLYFLDTTASMGFIKKHEISQNSHIPPSVKIGKPLCKDRYSFSVSYAIEIVEVIEEHWYETNKGKRIFTVNDNRTRNYVLQFRLVLDRFLLHLDWDREQEITQRDNIIINVCTLAPDVEGGYDVVGGYCTQQVSRIPVDLNKCRMAYSLAFTEEEYLLNNDYAMKYCYKSLEQQMDSKVPEINETLCGVKYDGELVSAKGQPLVQYRICVRCHLPVFMSSESLYGYECARCGEITPSEALVVYPEHYEKLKESLANFQKRG